MISILLNSVLFNRWCHYLFQIRWIVTLYSAICGWNVRIGSFEYLLVWFTTILSLLRIQARSIQYYNEWNMPRRLVDRNQNAMDTNSSILFISEFIYHFIPSTKSNNKSNENYHNQYVLSTKAISIISDRCSGGIHFMCNDCHYIWRGEICSDKK